MSFLLSQDEQSSCISFKVILLRQFSFFVQYADPAQAGGFPEFLRDTLVFQIEFCKGIIKSVYKVVQSFTEKPSVKLFSSVLRTPPNNIFMDMRSGISYKAGAIIQY